ncbi:HD domain-containing protein [Candidatus Micrarchaeota archaeon]|nr:HD domain-containing protein [Candidatus Micrarchaeota archaeon]
MHSRHVAAMSQLVMEKIVSNKKLSFESKLFWSEAARCAGLVHDIGKIHFPDEMGDYSVSFNEYIPFILEHTIYGFNILFNEIIKYHTDEFIIEVLDAVIHHHERWDGKRFEYSFKVHERPGYPHGLKHEEINPIARVIYVVDYYDASVNRGIKGMSRQTAIEWIKKGKDVLYDPEAVNAFIDSEKELYVISQDDSGALILDEGIL